MNNSTTQIFCASRDFQKDFRKRTWILTLFWGSIILIYYYYSWVSITSPAKKFKTNDNLANVFSIFNPLRTQEDYIVFLFLGIIPAFFVAVGVFWIRSKKANRLSTKTVRITSEEIIQEFENKATQKLLWNKIEKIELYKKDPNEFLYIKIYSADQKKLIVYGIEPWSELIFYTQKICGSRNIELAICNARIGSKGYLLESIDFVSVLIPPSIMFASQLKAIGLQLTAYILMTSSIIFTFTSTAFFTEPLDNDRTKYKYWSFSLMFLFLSLLILLIKFKF